MDRKVIQKMEEYGYYYHPKDKCFSNHTQKSILSEKFAEELVRTNSLDNYFSHLAKKIHKRKK